MGSVHSSSFSEGQLNTPHLQTEKFGRIGKTKSDNKKEYIVLWYDPSKAEIDLTEDEKEKHGLKDADDIDKVAKNVLKKIPVLAERNISGDISNIISSDAETAKEIAEKLKRTTHMTFRGMDGVKRVSTEGVGSKIATDEQKKILMNALNDMKAYIAYVRQEKLKGKLPFAEENKSRTLESKKNDTDRFNLVKIRDFLIEVRRETSIFGEEEWKDIKAEKEKQERKEIDKYYDKMRVLKKEYSEIRPKKGIPPSPSLEDK